MGIELVNLKGNITLGGELNGQVELNNTITDEIRDLLESGKHIETIINDDPKERMILDIWALDPGIYYLGGEGNGFYGDLTHGTNTEDTTQRLILASGSILILGGAYTAEIIEKEAAYLMGAIRRSYIAIGTTNHSTERFYTGSLSWSSINGFSGTANLVENSGNRVDVIDDKAKKTTYPNTKAVKDYVDAAMAGIEIPEASGGIIEITEDTFAYDLPTGVYAIHGNGDYALYPDDSMWPCFYNGVAIISNNIEIDGEYTWIFVGMDDSWAENHWQGVSHLDPDYGEYVPKYVGVPEHDGNKRNNLVDPNFINSTCYPTTQAVVEYINSKLVPIEIDVGSEHADNEYYNANTVDQVLIEVVGMMEAFQEYIETFALGLDDLTARVEALESK